MSRKSQLDFPGNHTRRPGRYQKQILIPVSYTHLDVYKRQDPFRYPPQICHAGSNLRIERAGELFILHLMESVDIPCGKFRSLLSGHLVGDELASFLRDKKAWERLVLLGNVCRFFEKIGERNFAFT